MVGIRRLHKKFSIRLIFSIFLIAVGNFGPGAASFTVKATVIGNPHETARAVRIASSTDAPTGEVKAPIELESQGDENALGFSLAFDPATLKNPQVALGADANGAQFNADTS